MTENQVAEFFETHTSDYKSGLKPGSENKLQFIQQTLDDEPGTRVLDIGCGSGVFASAVGELFESVSILGTDITRDMYAEQTADVELLLSDAQKLPFESDSFQLIHLDAVLHHIVGESRSESKEKAKQTFSELFRILEPGGHILITERIQRARIVSDEVLSSGIFYGLKYASAVLHSLHPQIYSDQPPICFYSIEELASMVDDQSGNILEKDVFDNPSSHPLEILVRPTSLRVTLYITDQTEAGSSTSAESSIPG